MYDQNDYIVYQDGIGRVIEVENNQVIIEDYISQEIKKYKSPSYYQKDLFFRNY